MNLSVTSNVVYIRFHGLEGGAAHDYTRRELSPWADFIPEQADRKRIVYAYFNNDINVRAPENARMLMEMVGDHAVQPPFREEPRFDFPAPDHSVRSRFKPFGQLSISKS